MSNLHRLLSIAALAALAAACQRAAEQNEQAPTPPASNGSSPVAIPLPERPLDREALLVAAVRAASAAATGEDDLQAQRALDGRRFEFALPFGCPAAPAGDRTSPAAAPKGAKQGKETLRLSARPDVSLDDPALEPIIRDAQFEAVEGFWIKRPWLLKAICPPPPAAAPEDPPAEPLPVKTNAGGTAAPAQQRIAIAQFFTTTDTRAGRRLTRPFEAVVSADDNGEIEQSGYNLVLAGRLRALPSQRVIACAGGGALRPPECVISAEFQEIRMEHPVTREVLARWAD